MKLKLFQSMIFRWTLGCFGAELANDPKERNHRFIEESLELVQSLGCSKEDVLMLVDYVYGRPAGEPKQEIGGVMVSLCALCNAHDIEIEDCAKEEEVRIWTKIDKIREKQKGKPRGATVQ